MKNNKMMMLLLAMFAGISQSALLSMGNFYDSFKENLLTYGPVEELAFGFKSTVEESEKKLEKNDEIKTANSVKDALSYDGELITYIGIGTYSDDSHESGYLQSLPSFLEKCIKDKNLQGKVKIILIDEAWGNTASTAVGDFKNVGYAHSSLKKYINSIKDEELKKAIKAALIIVDKNSDDTLAFIKYAKNLLDKNGVLFLGEGVRDYHGLMDLITSFTKKKDESYQSRLQLISVYTMQTTNKIMHGVNVASSRPGNPIWWGNNYNQKDYTLMLSSDRNTEENKKYIESDKCAGRFVALNKEESLKNAIPELKFLLKFSKDKTGIEEVIPLINKWSDKKIYHNIGDALKYTGELVTYIGFGTPNPAKKPLGYLQSLPSFFEHFFSIKELEGKIKIILIEFCPPIL